MPFIIIITLIAIPILFYTSCSKAENIKENSPLQQNTVDLQKASSKDALNRLQGIHNFESIFDNYHLGAIPYETFE